jgi:hypothetical protein
MTYRRDFIRTAVGVRRRHARTDCADGGRCGADRHERGCRRAETDRRRTGEYHRPRRDDRPSRGCQADHRPGRGRPG